MDRKRQLELITAAEERAVGHFKKWTANPQVKAALQRQVRGDDHVQHAVKRVRVG